MHLIGPGDGRTSNRVHFRRLLPRLWLVLTLLALIGGIIYTPNNYDYLSYRFPRVLNWCWEQKWHWIDTANGRMNYSADLFEWMMVPSFLLFKTDRLFFLINFASYLFFPGLVFSVFRRLGISGRICWWWMWVLPSGYCYILQATGLGNDSIAAVYFLASLYFLFLFWETGAGRHLAFSTLAIALMTGAKASNLPLLLPWALLLVFTRGQVLRVARPGAVVIVLAVAAVASFGPIGVMNQIQTGTVFGDPDNIGKMKVTHPLLGVLGNALQIGSEISLRRCGIGSHRGIFWPPSVRSLLSEDFPRLELGQTEFPTEDGAGVGLGCLMASALFIAASAWARRYHRAIVVTQNRVGKWITGAAAISLLVYMSKIASEAAPRLVTPYYLLVIAGVLTLAALDGQVVRWSLFRWAGLAVILSAFPLVVLAPARPLFPTHAVSGFLERHAGAGLSPRFDAVYGLYASRAFAFQDVMPLIPATEGRIGFLQNGNALEAALWRPFGSHRVVAVASGESGTEMRARGIHWVVVSGDALTHQQHTDIATVLTRWSGNLVAEKHFAMTVHQGEEVWYVVSLNGT